MAGLYRICCLGIQSVHSFSVQTTLQVWKSCTVGFTFKFLLCLLSLWLLHNLTRTCNYKAAVFSSLQCCTSDCSNSLTGINATTSSCCRHWVVTDSGVEKTLNIIRMIFIFIKSEKDDAWLISVRCLFETKWT